MGFIFPFYPAPDCRDLCSLHSSNSSGRGCGATRRGFLLPWATPDATKGILSHVHPLHGRFALSLSSWQRKQQLGFPVPWRHAARPSPAQKLVSLPPWSCTSPGIGWDGVRERPVTPGQGSWLSWSHQFFPFHSQPPGRIHLPPYPRGQEEQAPLCPIPFSPSSPPCHKKGHFGGGPGPAPSGDAPLPWAFLHPSLASHCPAWGWISKDWGWGWDTDSLITTLHP